MSISKQIAEEGSAIQPQQRVRVGCVGNSSVEAQWHEPDRRSRGRTAVARQDTGEEDAEIDDKEVGFDGRE